MSLFHHIQSWPALDVTKQVKPKNESLEQKDQNTTQLNVNETDLGKFTMIRTEEENRLIIVAQMMSTKSFFLFKFHYCEKQEYMMTGPAMEGVIAVVGWQKS